MPDLPMYWARPAGDRHHLRRAGLHCGLGGLLISLRLADAPQPPMASLWVKSTYIVAQYLLASEALARSVVVGQAEDVTRPALLT